MKVPVISGAGGVGMATLRDLAESLGGVRMEGIIADVYIARRRQNHRNHPENTCGRNGEG